MTAPLSLYENALDIITSAIIIMGGFILFTMALVTVRKLRGKLGNYPWIAARIFQAGAGLILSLSYIFIFIVPSEVSLHAQLLRPAIAVILVSLIIPVIYSYRSRGF